MPSQPHILILTGRTGGGHLSLADALSDLLQEHFKITIVDALPPFFQPYYRFVGYHTLWLWSVAFHLSNTQKRALSSHRVLTPVIAGRVKWALEQVQPDIVITTHSLLSLIARRVVEKYSPRTPFVMLFSDPYSIHSTWFSVRDAEASLAPTRETYVLALSAGFDPQRLHLVGWPVRGQFYHADVLKRTETLSHLDLDPEGFTIFLQGGGDGATNFWRSAEPLLAANPGMQIILAAGTNRALLRRFRGVKRLYAFPFTNEVAPLMAAADVIMGKAGPNVLFEAVTLGKPFIATTYFPGQEAGNLEFIEHYGLGWVALKFEQQCELVRSLTTADPRTSAVAAKIEEYRRWNRAANESILPVIRSLLPAAM